jgi:2-keto-4-pentenoate hydratase/2-oxohepta-3-ene-1,7-dioic acid hydratase in catechol pathway
VKLATYEHAGRRAVGTVGDGTVAPLAFEGWMVELIGSGCDRDDVRRGGYLRPGDVVAVEIDGIGSLTNPVVPG